MVVYKSISLIMFYLKKNIKSNEKIIFLNVLKNNKF